MLQDYVELEHLIDCWNQIFRDIAAEKYARLFEVENMSWGCSELSNMSFRCWQSLSDALKKIKLSSANNKWEMNMWWPNFSPRICLFLSAYISRLENASAQIKKRYEDKGHLCLKLLWGMIIPVGVLFMITEKDTIVIQSITNLIHFSLKPNLLIVCSRKAHSTLS